MLFHWNIHKTLTLEEEQLTTIGFSGIITHKALVTKFLEAQLRTSSRETRQKANPKNNFSYHAKRCAQEQQEPEVFLLWRGVIPSYACALTEKQLGFCTNLLLLLLAYSPLATSIPPPPPPPRSCMDFNITPDDDNDDEDDAASLRFQNAAALSGSWQGRWQPPSTLGVPAPECITETSILKTEKKKTTVTSVFVYVRSSLSRSLWVNRFRVCECYEPSL